MYDVEIADRQSALVIAPEWVEEIVRQTLAFEQVIAAQIAVALLDDAGIHVVNRDFLQHDYATDVISFLYSSRRIEEAAGPLGLRGAGFEVEGEIVISTETALRTATEIGSPAEGEVALYLVHGLLHLCGYDDQSSEERQLMRVRERAVLRTWNLVPREQF